jgi:hypothetical protein
VVIELDERSSVIESLKPLSRVELNVIEVVVIAEPPLVTVFDLIMVPSGSCLPLVFVIRIESRLEPELGMRALLSAVALLSANCGVDTDEAIFLLVAFSFDSEDIFLLFYIIFFLL